MVSALVIVSQYYFTYRDLKSNTLSITTDYNNYYLFKTELAALIRFAKRRVFKIFVYVYEYVLHIFVRIEFSLRKASDSMYIKSRDAFFKKALKDKKSINRFWPHLKEYKKEIDIEKEKLESE